MIDVQFGSDEVNIETVDTSPVGEEHPDINDATESQAPDNGFMEEANDQTDPAFEFINWSEVQAFISPVTTIESAFPITEIMEQASQRRHQINQELEMFKKRLKAEPFVLKLLFARHLFTEFERSPQNFRQKIGLMFLPKMDQLWKKLEEREKSDFIRWLNRHLIEEFKVNYKKEGQYWREKLLSLLGRTHLGIPPDPQLIGDLKRTTSQQRLNHKNNLFSKVRYVFSLRCWVNLVEMGLSELLIDPLPRLGTESYIASRKSYIAARNSRFLSSQNNDDARLGAKKLGRAKRKLVFEEEKENVPSLTPQRDLRNVEAPAQQETGAELKPKKMRLS